jgi:tetratricopeptide (TPR) repeat protein
VSSTLFWAVAPISSDDLWWHLSLGEAFSKHGPWLDSDPLLFSAVSPPIPHSWLFDVFVSSVDRTLGLRGLRILHGLACLGIIVLAYRIFRRGRKDRALALTATALFLAVALNRLIRIRPDLFSIAACLLLYLLLLADDKPPSQRRIAASVFVMLLWANAHALFALGPLLLCIALGAWLVTPVLTRTRGFSPLERLWIRRLGSAISLGFLFALLNPRGISQHLSFVRSAQGDALWSVMDDWTPFDPFSWTPLRGAIPFATWVVTDAILGLFIVLAIYLGIRHLRDPETTPLTSLQLPLLGLASASLVAVAVSSRFLWMAFFPILWLQRCLPMALPNARRSALSWGAAAVCVVVMLTFPNLRMLKEFGSGRMSWILEQNLKKAYPVEGVKFLSEAGLEGNLFARYSTSGFLGYWLSPRIQTLVNASMNFPPEAFEDYFAIVNEEGARPGERFTDVLDRWDIDLFFGMGTPNPATFLYSTPDLEAEPEWLLVHRSLDHAIYHRRAPNHSENLARVAAFYSAQGIPFDSDVGLDVGAILRDHTQWAIETRMLPTRYLELRVRMRAGNRQALEHLAVIHLLLGDYSAAIRFDQKILVLDSEALGARRRLVYGLLKLGRVEEASAHAQALAADDRRRDLPSNVPGIAPRLRKLVQRGLEIERSGGFDTVSPQIRDAWRRDLNSLYPITDREHQTIMRSLLLPPPTLVAPRRDRDGSSLPPVTSRK